MSNLIEHRSRKIFILLMDLLIVIVAYILSFYLRIGTIDSRNWEAFYSLIPWILLISLFFFSIYELYQIYRKNFWDLARSVFVASTLITLVTMATSFFLREFALPRSIILLSYLLLLVFLLVWKFIILKLFKIKKNENILVIAKSEEFEHIKTQMKGLVHQNSRMTMLDQSANWAKIKKYIQDSQIIIIGDKINTQQKTEIINLGMKYGKITYIVPSLYELLLAKGEVTQIDDTMVLGVRPFGLSTDQLFIKRVTDILLSIISLVIFAPIMIIIAISLKLQDKGSVIYKQERITTQNRPFKIYKFRTMIENAEEVTGPVLSTDKDPRVTRVGRFLRSTRLDEIPQFWNVLKGDMSVVGPRPERPEFIREIIKNNKSFTYRTTVKPGITGYAQIRGKYSTSFEDKLRYDLYYIRNYSFWLDLIIILQTITIIFDKSKSQGKDHSYKIKNVVSTKENTSAKRVKQQ